MTSATSLQGFFSRNPDLPQHYYSTRSAYDNTNNDRIHDIIFDGAPLQITPLQLNYWRPPALAGVPCIMLQILCYPEAKMHNPDDSLRQICDVSEQNRDFCMSGK